MSSIPFATVDWSSVPVTQHRGLEGMALWRTLEVGGLRLRSVEYTPGYRADHWCHLGHVLFVVDGELLTELEDGRTLTLTGGQSYQVSTGQEGHRSTAPRGARLFIVDSTSGDLFDPRRNEPGP